MISFDTLRADRLGAYGYHRDTSPSFDRLATRGTLFERVVVQYPSTLTSHMSIFTGVYPQEHRVLPPSTVLSPAIQTIPERFLAAGYRTAGHTEGGFVAGGYGFRRGFEEFTDTPYGADTDVERTFERGLEFLRRLGPEERFLLFLHTYTIHDPYEPPETYRALFWKGGGSEAFDSSGESLRAFNRGERELAPSEVEYHAAMYDASVRYADEVLGRFVGELEALGLLSETTLIITSDHGEEFLEHGRLAHTQLYPESLLVPLLIVHPGLPTGTRVPGVVETVDLAPTLYELAGLPPAEQVSGRSLAPLLGGEGEATGAAFGYAEVLEVEFVRTLVAQDEGHVFQPVVVEPEWDPLGSWIRRTVSFDTEEKRLEFEAQSFHAPRSIRLTVDGSYQSDIQLEPGWQPIVFELPAAPKVHRVRMEADGCISPAEVGASDDGRCLAFQVRGLEARRFELYDLARDPHARNDVMRQLPEVRRRLSNRLLARRWRELGEAGERTLTDAERRTLRALGYLQ